MAIEITIQPTGDIQDVNGVPHRIWKGTTAEGVPVHAFITMVSPQTHDQAVNERFARELRAIQPERRLVSFDWRLAL